MRLRYDRHVEGDHVTVTTPSFLAWCWRVVRYGVAGMFLLVVIGELGQGHILAAGIPLLFATLAYPKRKGP